MNSKKPMIKCAVLRLQHGSLIVPFNLIAEMVTVDHLENSDMPGILGWLSWLNRPVPVVSLESLCLLGEGNIETASNCLILHTVSDCEDLPFIALQVQGGLQTVEISEDTLRDDYSGNTQRCPYVARQVRISQLVCLIPDLPALEASVVEILAYT
ncbi:chemotaxis protein CheW [uncultured Thiothrix sp.]|uniref:chemotaxis protein CheW n=1 Tax=uncultured Thiothrix sp. TaxID=223185 RepID=UPI0026094B77|nr:chemotaxis protein CheW [uncultured Thiothrix sp.]HMT93355.1 chemotaxis protein CheW [Thiolinea sp.]